MKIVTIGGGERAPAITHAIELSGDEKPHILINPSSASTESSYNKKVLALSEYLGNFGATTSVLHEFNEHPPFDKIKHELGRASLIYTLGGNSPYMLRTMRKHGSDTAFIEAITAGTVHIGTSAGALLPFDLAHSNVSARPSEEEWDFEYLPTLGLIPGVATAHADQHDPTPHGLRSDTRLESLMRTFPADQNVGYAIDNHAAIVFNEGERYAIRAKSSANAHILQRTDQSTISKKVLS